MKKLPWNNMGFLTVLSMLAVMGLKYCVNEPKQALTYSNSILTFLLWLGVLYLLRMITRGESWKEIREILFPCFCFLFFFTGALAAGVQLDREGAVDFSSWMIGGGIDNFSGVLTSFGRSHESIEDYFVEVACLSHSGTI